METRLKFIFEQIASVSRMVHSFFFERIAQAVRTDNNFFQTDSPSHSNEYQIHSNSYPFENGKL